MLDEWQYCKACGFMYPASYSYCQACVYGLDNQKIGRIGCKTCGTTVGEHIIKDEYWEYVNKCNYCDPIGEPHDDDIVGRHHFWSFKKDAPPEKILVTTTRAERRQFIESGEKFADWLKSIQEESANFWINSEDPCEYCGGKMILDTRDGYSECVNPGCESNEWYNCP